MRAAFIYFAAAMAAPSLVIIGGFGVGAFMKWMGLPHLAVQLGIGLTITALIVATIVAFAMKHVDKRWPWEGS